MSWRFSGNISFLRKISALTECIVWTFVTFVIGIRLCSFWFRTLIISAFPRRRLCRLQSLTFTVVVRIRHFSYAAYIWNAKHVMLIIARHPTHSHAQELRKACQLGAGLGDTCPQCPRPPRFLRLCYSKRMQCRISENAQCVSRTVTLQLNLYCNSKPHKQCVSDNIAVVQYAKLLHMT